jgi:hypothetical protein
VHGLMPVNIARRGWFQRNHVTSKGESGPSPAYRLPNRIAEFEGTFVTSCD